MNCVLGATENTQDTMLGFVSDADVTCSDLVCIVPTGAGFDIPDLLDCNGNTYKVKSLEKGFTSCFRCTNPIAGQTMSPYCSII